MHVSSAISDLPQSQTHASAAISDVPYSSMHVSAAIWDVPRRQKHVSAAIPDVPRSRRHVSVNLLDVKNGQKQTAPGGMVIFAQIGGGTSDYLVVRRQALSATPPSPGVQRRKPPSTRDCGGETTRARSTTRRLKGGVALTGCLATLTPAGLPIGRLSPRRSGSPRTTRSRPARFRRKTFLSSSALAKVVRGFSRHTVRIAWTGSFDSDLRQPAPPAPPREDRAD